MTFSQYRSELQKALAQGNATEGTHRHALKALLESLKKGITATNEPKRVACGAPDFIVSEGATPQGYIETKDIGVSLDEAERGEQLARYLDSLSNLVLTDYLEFRWFLAGERRMAARLASVERGGKLRLSRDGERDVAELLHGFLTVQAPAVGTSRELAERMAGLARLIRDTIGRAFREEGTGGKLHEELGAFREVLIHDLTPEQFADMYAQTICYGLFAARCSFDGPPPFTRQHAPYDLPKTNPFLRRMFTRIAGPELDDRIAWAVDDLAHLLDRSDVAAILAEFGARTRREDPVFHFYETFLAVYDPKMREARGVYYTPDPVVSYIVRSVDRILKEDFGLKDGLADRSMVRVKLYGDKEGTDVHRVLVLDPACGTGTFLYHVIKQIREHFAGNQGMWSGYVREHLLPRLFGFELLMAPYAVAHMKLGMLLKETGYDFVSDERVRIYLTNTLEEAHRAADLPLFTRWLAEEANAASDVKQHVPVMVVLGNPPYSGQSENVGEWINHLLRGMDTLTGERTANYFEADGKHLGEVQLKWLHDDYVKFIRFAQWRIEQTGYGILAFVTNHGYLDNPTFRGMRQSLMATFEDIYLLNLHGNSLKKETAPDGSPDENVFDIRQGVAIGLFVKHGTGPAKPTVRYADLWGLREAKYARLRETDLTSTTWIQVNPAPPFYLFVPQDVELLSEYTWGWQVSDVFPVNSVGIVTARDRLTIRFEEEQVWTTVRDFSGLDPEEARSKYRLGADVRDWKVVSAQEDLRRSGPSTNHILPLLYRPFDCRYTYYTGTSRGFIGQPQARVSRHMLAGENVGLVTPRRVETAGPWQHVLVTADLIDHVALSLKTIDSLFPLYLYPDPSKGLGEGGGPWPPGTGGRRPNLAPEFVREFGRNLGMEFVSDGKGDLGRTFGPEDVFSYIYAVLHSPTYRERYAEFLKIDFPRVPLTSHADLFRTLCGIGDRLVALHLLEASITPVTRYPVAGDNRVEKGYPKYRAPRERVPGEKEPLAEGRVYINKEQYFEGVPPEVWEFHVGGYQVCEKWLKDRSGRSLTYDDLAHYQKVVAALAETIRLMAEIDTVITAHGGWPAAFGPRQAESV